MERMNYMAAPGCEMKISKIEMIADENEIKGMNFLDRQEMIIDLILKSVSTYSRISESAIKSQSRTTEIRVARQRCMYFGDLYSKLKMLTVSQMFGGKEHAKVFHSKRVIEKIISLNAKYPTKINTKYIQELDEINVNIRQKLIATGLDKDCKCIVNLN